MAASKECLPKIRPSISLLFGSPPNAPHSPAAVATPFRRRQCDGHPPLGGCAASRSRIVHASGHQELLRPRGSIQSEGRRGFGAKNAITLGDPESPSESFAGA